MTFTSVNFYVILAVLLALYYLLPLKLRWLSLLAGSMVFYWFMADRSYVKLILLVAAALVTWGLTLWMAKAKKGRKLLLTVDILVIALPLLAVKEFWLAETLLKIEKPGWWIVPLGLAFYSMQLIAYAADVYREKSAPEKNVLHFVLFVSFFPQVIQGPIPRYGELAPQLFEGHRFDEKKFVKGFMLILWGFFLKLCIADKAAVIVNEVFGRFPAYQGAYVLVAAVLYSFQLYADFLACTSFAQGVSGLFGIELAENFNHPYFAVSVKDFWRRWHLSLSSWLKDYIYIPLGGNRKGRVRKYLNILITFAVSGIWHGAGIRYLVWGLIHGVYQIIGDLFAPLRKKLRSRVSGEEKNRFLDLLCMLFTYCLVTLAWVIFRAEDLKTGWEMLRSIFTVYNPWILTNDALFSLGLVWKEWVVLLVCLVILWAVSKKQEKGIVLRDKILSCHLVVRWGIYLLAILFVLLFGTYGYGYDAQAFIYGGF